MTLNEELEIILEFAENKLLTTKSNPVCMISDQNEYLNPYSSWVNLISTEISLKDTICLIWTIYW